MSRSARITPTETKKARNSFFYSDLKTNFNVHPLTKELARAVDEEAVRNAVRNRILTNFGEIPYQPLFGSNIMATLFEQNTPETFLMLNTLIEQSLADEPRIQLQNVSIEEYSTNDVRITINYYIKNIQTSASLGLTLKRVR